MRWISVLLILWSPAIAAEALQGSRPAQPPTHHERLSLNPISLEGANFTVLDGLSSNCVYRIEHDPKGFIWLATSKGLDRFDGRQFKHFPYSDMVPSDHRLAHQFISLFATEDDRFLVTLSQSLIDDAFDVVIAFDPIALEVDTAYHLPNPGLRGRMVQWKDGSCHWDFSSAQRDSVLLFQGDRPISGTFSFHPILDWCPWNGTQADSSLLVQALSDDQRFLLRDGDTTRLITTRHAALTGHNLQGEWDGLIHRCDGRSIWYFCRGTEQDQPAGTLMRIHPDGHRTAEGHWDSIFPFAFPAATSRLSLQHNPWNDETWCFKDDELVILNGRNEVLLRKTISDHKQFASLINTVKFNSASEICVGSCKGLHIFHTASSPFEALFTAEMTAKEDREEATPVTNNCRTIVELGADSFAFSTNMHGVRLHSGGQSRMIVPERGAGAGLFHEHDTLFFCTPDGLGYWAESGQPQWLSRFEDFPLLAIWSLERWDAHRWMIGGLGMMTLNTATGEMSPLFQQDGSALGDVYHFDRWRDTLWVCSSSGVHAWNESGQHWIPWHKTTSGAPVIQEALHRFIDTRGVHWFGTSTQGLIRYDPEEGTMDQYSTEEGVPSTTVYGGFEDPYGVYWFSTDQGLFQWHPATEEPTLFDERHGLHESEFNRTGIHLGASGTAYFSTINGLVRFPTGSFKEDNLVKPPIVITSMMKHGAASDSMVDVLASFERTGKLVLEPKDDFIALGIALLDYSGLPRQYRYNTSNPERPASKWAEMEGPNLNLAGLPPGASQIRIQARRRGEPWGAIEQVIPVEMGIPWHEQPLHIAWMVLTGLGLIGGGITLRVRSLTARNTLLESMVLQRTQSLKEALLAKDVYLKEVHHRVKNNLQIMGDLLDLQSDQESHSNVREALATGRSRLESIALIHKHLYLDSDAQTVGLKEFINEYVSHVQDGLVNQRDHVRWHLEGDEVHFDIECGQAFGLLLNELVTNSLRHARVEGQPLHIDIRWTPLSPGYIRLHYADNGQGLPQTLDLETAHSLGLKLIRSLTGQLEGSMKLHPDNRTQWVFDIACSFRNRESTFGNRESPENGTHPSLPQIEP